MFSSRKSKSASLLTKHVRLNLEKLEAREVLYSATANAWVKPELITISFVPDGTVVGIVNNMPVESNLFATMNARFGSPATWQAEILKAAQVWAQQTNINFTVVGDDGAEIGTGNYQQGDPNHGDIRIGGFEMGNTNADPLGISYMPPPVNNYDIAGDLQLNTSRYWTIGSSTQPYDLFTAAVHELGHSLGLGHSNGTSGASTTSVMWDTYTNRKTALATDDINGIRAIAGWTSGLLTSVGYQGARKHDAYDLVLSNGTFAAASVVTPVISTVTKTAVLNNLNITSTTDVDFYRLVVPVGLGGDLTIQVQSQGLSLLTPSLAVYNGSQQLVGSALNATTRGATLSTTLSVTAGQTYFIRVGGAVSASTTPFGTGAYAVSMAFGGVALAAVSMPVTNTPNSQDLSGGGGLNNEFPPVMMMPAMHVSYPDGCGCDDHDHGHDENTHVEAEKPDAGGCGCGTCSTAVALVRPGGSLADSAARSAFSGLARSLDADDRRTRPASAGRSARLAVAVGHLAEVAPGDAAEAGVEADAGLAEEVGDPFCISAPAFGLAAAWA